MVAMCRPLLADPEMPRKYALGREEDHRPCLRCQYCGFRLMIPAVINCAVNPYLGNETEFPEGKVKKAEVKKRVAVVGGGPAGIQAMLTLCERGHDVTLYEKSDRLGGHVVPASALPFKQDVKDYLDYLVRQANKAPARILLNTEATKELLDAEGYEALIIAVGSKPIVPRLPGIDKPHVHWAPDADTGEVKPGDKTVIVGAGSVGIECAIGLKRAGKDVTVVEMAPDMANLRASAGGAAMELMALVEELGDPRASQLQARGSDRLDRGLPRHETRRRGSSFPPTRCFWPSAWPRGTTSPTPCAAAPPRQKCSWSAMRRRWGRSPRPSGPPSRRPRTSRPAPLLSWISRGPVCAQRRRGLGRSVHGARRPTPDRARCA